MAFYKLKTLLSEYKIANLNQIYKPVAVGKYGIRKREEIYKKELSKDYSKNKVIYKDTLIIGMGSGQIDIGVLVEDKIYCVSPAYKTFEINTKLIRSEFLNLLLKQENSYFSKKYLVPSARQGKKVDLTNFFEERIFVPSFEKQDSIVKNIKSIYYLIEKNKSIFGLLDQLLEAMFDEMFRKTTFPLTPIREFVDERIISSKRTFLKTDLIKYIDISSINNITNEITSKVELQFEKAPSRAQQAVHKFDILVSTVRPNLKNIAIIVTDESNLVASSGFCVLRTHINSPYYLLYSVLSNEFTEKMKEKTKGATYPAINDKDIMEFLIPKVPLKMQLAFEQIVLTMKEIKENVNKFNNKLNELLIQKMDEYLGGSSNA
jgi:restriction endonuclease S subunit